MTGPDSSPSTAYDRLMAALRAFWKAEDDKQAAEFYDESYVKRYCPACGRPIAVSVSIPLDRTPVCVVCEEDFR